MQFIKVKVPCRAIYTVRKLMKKNNCYCLAFGNKSGIKKTKARNRRRDKSKGIKKTAKCTHLINSNEITSVCYLGDVDTQKSAPNL